MILLFSEYKSDYSHYIFPYAIWALPEEGEQPSDLFAHGFLPSSRFLDRYYLCRQIRIQLDRFQLSSENRRILRKGRSFSCRLIRRQDFELTDERRNFCKAYAEAKFGLEVMSHERLENLFSAPIISHLLVFEEMNSGKEVGLATLFLQPPVMAYYYYAFYDLEYFSQNLGMYMMTSAAETFSRMDLHWLYLGTCYNQNALYKTQFQGVQFFNGFTWSDELQELKYLLKRDSGPISQHLLETEEFQAEFYRNSLTEMSKSSNFKIK
jgi:arginyl-tRNA--protein-N-Asp/Glu arginylyltransferase